MLSDEELARLLEGAARVPVERARQVFVNRNLRMAQVEMVGFDMDYTLAIYHQRRIEQLSFDLTLSRLVTDFGYPAEVGLLQYDHGFVIRGPGGRPAPRQPHQDGPLRERGARLPRAVAAAARRNATGCTATSGSASPPSATPGSTRSSPCPRPGSTRRSSTCSSAQGRKVDYGRLYDDIREAIDAVHRDNSLKREVRKDIGQYIFRDPELGPALHKLRSGGKKLFVLTNSLWDYTDAVMSFLLDGVLPEYPSWRNYFDVVITGASKPAFFTEQRPFLEVDTDGSRTTRCSARPPRSSGGRSTRAATWSGSSG